jgi:hypothetical protein
VDARCYWPQAGLSQRFFLMMLPGGRKQLSLALLSRGERLEYVVVGENDRVSDCDPAASVDPGSALKLLHRRGRWIGTLIDLDERLSPRGAVAYEERVRPDAHGLTVLLAGGAQAPEPTEMRLRSDGSAAWSDAGPLSGSYSLSGGRALSGVFSRADSALAVWRREVASRDGTLKAVLHTVLRGGARVGVQHGVLRFEAEP